MAVIQRSELVHFSKSASREDVLLLPPEKRAELVESAITSLYRSTAKVERDDLLSLVQTILRNDFSIANRFEHSAYVVCNRHLVITQVNRNFLTRSNVDEKDIIGRSLYYERRYEGTQIEQLYSMVMETRMVADALVRYAHTSASGQEYNGWFVLVVIPLEEGGIGVLSRFAKEREELAEHISPEHSGAMRYIELT